MGSTNKGMRPEGIKYSSKPGSSKLFFTLLFPLVTCTFILVFALYLRDHRNVLAKFSIPFHLGSVLERSGGYEIIDSTLLCTQI
jgi:hypothetical protein